MDMKGKGMANKLTPEGETPVSENGHGATWDIDVSDIRTMKPIFEWNAAVEAGRMTKVREMMQARIKQWPFEGDPAAIEAWENLTPKQWTETLSKVGQTIGNVFQEAGN